MEHAAIKKREDEPVRDVWVAVFDMPRDLAKTWKHNEQLADRVERTDNIMHVNTESTQELEKRTVIVSKIPDDHVVAADPDADRQDPALSLTLMELLTVFGDIDVVTVHMKAEVTRMATPGRLSRTSCIPARAWLWKQLKERNWRCRG